MVAGALLAGAELGLPEEGAGALEATGAELDGAGEKPEGTLAGAEPEATGVETTIDE